jgi:hypothetical protein
VTVEQAVSMVWLIEELEAREAADRVRVEELDSKLAELTVCLEAEREAWSRLRVARETVAEVVAEMSGSDGASVEEQPVARRCGWSGRSWCCTGGRGCRWKTAQQSNGGLTIVA